LILPNVVECGDLQVKVNLAMDLKDLLARGYLPKELPPLVSSTAFSEYAVRGGVVFPTIKYTEGARHNFRRPGGARRGLTIPHPLAYLELGRSLERNWSLIEEVFSKSPFLASTPKVNISASGRSMVPSFYFPQRARARVRSSIGARFVLSGDLSQCYSSIYTHSIPWALEGKEVSKKKIRDGVFSTIVGNDIDVRSQRIQLRQTKGIPIGPDSSLILGELILSSIDQRLCSELSSRGNSRYRQAALRITDDFEYYASTTGEAEDVWLAWEKAANHFELHVNPSKTLIRELPEGFDSNWAIELTQMQIRHKSVSSLVRFFSVVRDLARECRESAVFGYAFQRLNRINWVFEDQKAWDVYSDMILASIMTEPSALKVGAVAFEQAELHGRVLDLEVMEQTLNQLASFHSELEHGSEVSWALFLLRRFKLKVQSDVAQKIALMEDNLSLLLLHHLVDVSLIEGVDPDLTVFVDRAESQDALSTSDWLLSYESAVQGWSSSAAFSSEPEMQAMLDAGVSFLDFGLLSVLEGTKLSTNVERGEDPIDWMALMEETLTSPWDLYGSMSPLW
jgi:hypothetical protein